MAGVNDIRDRAKSLWMKGMKSIGNTAASIASNTRYKVDEMTLQNRRRELSQDLSGRVYSLWQKGETFPPEIDRILKELQGLDEKLNDMQAARYAQGVQTAADTAEEETPAPEAEAEAEAEAEPEKDDAEAAEYMTDLEAHIQRTIEDTSSALEDEINARFDHPEVAEKAEKVNSSLHELSDRMRRFDEAGSDQEQP